MRRALDAARSQLAGLDDRDAMLDCFFEHARTLFQFAVLFVVRGDTVHGRNVDGIGAPDGLVSRLSFDLNAPGIFSRARDLRRPFGTASASTEADERLFGSLGRVMPNGMVIPLVVVDRVVAVLIGDQAAPMLEDRAQEAGMPAMELAKEEMLLWAQSVGEALEGLIRRRKGKTGSVPPPPLDPLSLAGTAMLTGDRPISNFPPAPILPSMARSEAMTSVMLGISDPYSQAPYEDASAALAPRSWVRAGILVPVGTVLAVAVIGLAVLLGRGKDDPERVIIAGTKLPGWPSNVDPMAVRAAALTAASLGDDAELESIQAEVTRGGRVDFRGSAASAGAAVLFRFVRDGNEAEVRADAEGVHGARSKSSQMCGSKPCRAAVPSPQCSFAQIWDASVTAGLGENDHAIVTYADDPTGGAASVWTVTTLGRGKIRLDPATCKPLARESLRPAALPIGAVPGAPKAAEPLALLPLARQQSGLPKDQLLVELDARGVNRKGQIDLGEPEGSIVYTFVEPPGTPGRRRVRRVSVSAQGMSSGSEQDDTTADPGSNTGLLQPPRCSVAHAIEYATIGTPPTGNVHVTFAADVVSPQLGRWSVEVASLGFHKSASDTECEAWESVRKN